MISGCSLLLSFWYVHPTDGALEPYRVICRLNHSHAYLFYIIYDGTQWLLLQSFIPSAFMKNSHTVRSEFISPSNIHYCVERCLPPKGPVLYRFANKIPYFSDQMHT